MEWIPIKIVAMKAKIDTWCIYILFGVVVVAVIVIAVIVVERQWSLWWNAIQATYTATNHKFAIRRQTGLNIAPRK